MRLFPALATACLLVTAPFAAPAAMAQTPPTPFVVYNDGFQNDWQSWSWAKAEFQVDAGGVKPARVQGDPWTALAFHHTAFSTAGYTKLTFYINGGIDGGQALAVKVLVDGKPVDSTYLIQPKAKTWAVVEVPLKDIGGDNKTIDGIWLQGQATAYTAYYIDKIQLE